MEEIRTNPYLHVIYAIMTSPITSQHLSGGSPVLLASFLAFSYQLNCAPLIISLLTLDLRRSRREEKLIQRVHLLFFDWFMPCTSIAEYGFFGHIFPPRFWKMWFEVFVCAWSPGNGLMIPLFWKGSEFASILVACLSSTPGEIKSLCHTILTSVILKGRVILPFPYFHLFQLFKGSFSSKGNWVVW